MNTVVVGAQFGDEGKGKVCDYLMQEHDICVRYSGACNTGATVYVDNKKYKFHHIPVGVIQNKKSYIAGVCYVNPQKLLKEIEELKNQGFDVDNLLKISPHCHVITQDHIIADERMEDSGKGVGSTKQGVSPCAADKYSRKGFRLFESIWHREFEKYFVDVSYDLNTAIKNGKNILFEGSQGALLDIDHGYYPYVSTSSNIAAAAPMACGIGPQHINRVVGVFKPYMTYVGTGDFSSEIYDKTLSDLIVERGNEYGTTTNRKRRIGWLSFPLLQYACRINGVIELAITKGDVLEGLPVYADTDLSLPTQSVEPLFLENYKANIRPMYQEFSLESFVSLPLFKKGNDYDFPSIKYISTGKNRHEMKVIDG